MAKDNGANTYACICCEEKVPVGHRCVDVIWYSREDGGFQIHHERDVHVTTQWGKIVEVEERPGCNLDTLVGLLHRRCTRGCATLGFPMRETMPMSRSEIIARVRKTVQSNIAEARRCIVRRRERAVAVA